MIARVLSFVAVVLTGIFITPLIALPLACFYAMRWFAPELLVVGFLIDCYFGAASSWPIFTLATFVIIVSAEAAKKYLLIKMIK
jgi:hypothetical protein